MDSSSADREALVTGEAVLLDLRTAPFPMRMIAGAIDGIVELAILVLGSIGWVTVAVRGGLDEGFAAAGILLVSLMAFIGYPVLCELLLGGRSAGRLAAGTRVVREDGGPVHARQSLLRAVMGMLELWSTSGALALACAVIDPRGRRLGDLMAGTVVLQERMRDRSAPRVSAPPQLEEWSRTADVGRLPLELVQDIRGFLPRSGRMHAESRRAISRSLLQRTLPHVAPAPPPGTDPEAFLTAVIAERSRRDQQRLERHREREQELVAQVRTLPFSA